MVRWFQSTHAWPRQHLITNNAHLEGLHDAQGESCGIGRANLDDDPLHHQLVHRFNEKIWKRVDKDCLWISLVK
jgi:hypothetical protein